MDEAEDDVLACVSFPVDHWPKLHSINGLEPLNGEIILGALICVNSVGAFKLMHRKRIRMKQSLYENRSTANKRDMMKFRTSRFGGAMTIRRSDQKAQHADSYPARLFPIQHEIQKLQKELNDFNERIAELEKVSHQGEAMEVLKANAVDFARKIDELRCLLVESVPKATKG